MTTIAVNKTGMAADGRACLDSQIATERAVKLYEDEDYIYGGAGDYISMSEAIGFLTGRISEDEVPETEEDFNLVRLDKKTGKISFTNKTLVWLEIDPPFAIGSGAGFAIGAMASGKSPKEAVKIACKFDAASGGKITEIKR